MGANITPEDPWPHEWWPEELWPEVVFAVEDLKEIASKELPRVRQRSIWRIDFSSHNQQPVKTPVLDSIADLYASLTDQEGADRPEKLRCLLWDALKKYGEQKQNTQGAAFVRELFFNPDDPEVPINPKKQVESLQGKLGFGGEHANIFAHRRRKEFVDFAAYLAMFIVREIEKENDRIKAERIKMEAEKERIEADRIKKEAKKQKERTKKEAQKERARAENDDVAATIVGQGKTKDQRRPTPNQRKRQLAREKFLRQQHKRDQDRSKARKRDAMVAAVLAFIVAVSLGYYFAHL